MAFQGIYFINSQYNSLNITTKFSIKLVNIIYKLIFFLHFDTDLLSISLYYSIQQNIKIYPIYLYR